MFNPITYYRGVIEDNNHPDKNGMVKVRVYGLHTEKNENSTDTFEFISTAQIPWAEVMHSADFGLVSGIGLSSVLKKGTWVWVVLENNDPNKPIVVGVISGKPPVNPTSKYDNGEGFFDPDGKYPIPSRINEQDINRLARSENLTSTIHNAINISVDVVTNTDAVSGADVSQTEPNSTSNATIYPNCTVLETASGHVIEIDDTTNNERVRLYHKSGSYVEFKPDGSIVQKTVGGGIDHFIHENDIQEHIAKSVKRYIESNVDEIIDGYIKRAVGGSIDEHILHNIRQTVAGAITIDAGGMIELTKGVHITGNLHVSGHISSDSNVVAAGEVSDSVSNLSHVRAQYDAHTHIGNLGVPTSITDKPDSGGGAAVVSVTVVEN